MTLEEAKFLVEEMKSMHYEIRGPEMFEGDDDEPYIAWHLNGPFSVPQLEALLLTARAADPTDDNK